jgi:hypothetical protein
MVASAVFVTDLNGKPIIHRNYRGDIPLHRAIDRFAKYLQDVPDELKKPVFYVDNTTGDYLLEDQVGSPITGDVPKTDDPDTSSAPTSNSPGETYVYITVGG